MCVRMSECARARGRACVRACVRAAYRTCHCLAAAGVAWHTPHHRHQSRGRCAPGRGRVRPRRAWSQAPPESNPTYTPHALAHPPAKLAMQFHCSITQPDPDAEMSSGRHILSGSYQRLFSQDFEKISCWENNGKASFDGDGSCGGALARYRRLQSSGELPSIVAAVVWRIIPARLLFL